MKTMVIVWLVLVVVFAVGEMATTQLISIWFAFGALCALIAAFCGANGMWQGIIFLIASGALLAATRPLVKKLLRNKPQATNADRVLGQTGVVQEEINNLEAHGQIKVRGQVWTARTREESTVIPVGARVVVQAIEGVKVIVAPEQEERA